MDSATKQRLLKALREGKVNRELACDALFAAEGGPEALLEACRAHRSHPQVLRAALRAFRRLEPEAPCSEQLLQELVASSRHPASEVRVACLEALRHLAATLPEAQLRRSPYLRASALNRRVYGFLADPCAEVRAAARQLLVRLKHFGRLVLLEGLRADESPVARAECVAGLAHFGLLSARPLLLGLLDPDLRVSQAAEAALQPHSAAALLQHFSARPEDLASTLLVVQKVLDDRNFLADRTLQKLAQLLADAQACDSPR